MSEPSVDLMLHPALANKATQSLWVRRHFHKETIVIGSQDRLLPQKDNVNAKIRRSS